MIQADHFLSNTGPVWRSTPFGKLFFTAYGWSDQYHSLQNHSSRLRGLLNAGSWVGVVEVPAGAVGSEENGFVRTGFIPPRRIDGEALGRLD